MSRLLPLVALLGLLAASVHAQQAECSKSASCATADASCRSPSEPVADTQVAPACASDGDDASCSLAAPSLASTDVPEGPLSPTDLDEIVAWVQELAREGGGKLMLSPQIIEDGTGFEMTMEALPQVTRAIEIAFGMPAGGTSRCADYGACSLYGDLSGATGETLSMYETERAQDGQMLGERDWLPAFKAQSLAGEPVASSDLLGQATLLVPLATHCTHSFQTLPLLQQITERYRADGLRVVGVWVNVPSADDVQATLDGLSQTYDVEFWVSPGDALGAALGSRLVPSHFLIADSGKMERKFVGFKDGAVLMETLDGWLRGTESVGDPDSVAGTH